MFISNECYNKTISKPIQLLLSEFIIKSEIGCQKRGYVRGNYKKSIEKKRLKKAREKEHGTPKIFTRKPVIIKKNKEYVDYKEDNYDEKKSEKKDIVEYWNDNLEKKKLHQA